MKLSNSFSISLISIAAVLLSGYLKLGMEAVIASVAATYVLGRGAQKASGVWAASKDINCNTAEVIKSLEGK